MSTLSFWCERNKATTFADIELFDPSHAPILAWRIHTYSHLTVPAGHERGTPAHHSGR